MPGHTPPPWHCSGPIKQPDSDYPVWLIYDEPGDLIATVEKCATPATNETTRANAERIVLAVNSHDRLTEQRDKLLAVLSRIVGQFETTADKDAVTIAYSQIEAGRAVIAKCEAADMDDARAALAEIEGTP